MVGNLMSRLKYYLHTTRIVVTIDYLDERYILMKTSLVKMSGKRHYFQTCSELSIVSVG